MTFRLPPFRGGYRPKPSSTTKPGDPRPAPPCGPGGGSPTPEWQPVPALPAEETDRG